MLVIGIDPDTKRISWAVFENGQYKCRGTFARMLKGRMIEVYRLDAKRFFHRAAERGAKVHVEDIFLGRDSKGKPLVTAYKALAGLQGELKFIAKGVGLELTFVSCLDWRRSQLGFVCGPDALQRASHLRAEELAGEPVSCPHESDATCIAAHGAGLAPARSYKPQRAVSRAPGPPTPAEIPPQQAVLAAPGGA